MRASAAAALLLAVSSLGLLVWAGLEPEPIYTPASAPPGKASASARPAEGEVEFSFLAVGDISDQHLLRSLREGQLSVARGMASEDLRHPADALVLLGDNFYPDGLTKRNLVEQIRVHLVQPFCRFLDLSGPRSGEVADACGLPPDRRHPVPIYAVLGNHDHKAPESPGLQREAVPRFISNWRLHQGVADLVELGRGLSLVLLDSAAPEPRRDPERVREALARARGPWRILAAHHPIAPRIGGAHERPAYREAMRRAIAETGVPVQLFLSGHRHNLQLIEMEPPGPALHVIAGAGSTRKRLCDPPFENRRFAIETTGFARVELVGRGSEQRLLVSLYTMPRYPVFFWVQPQLGSSWSVDRSGAARQEFPAPNSRSTRHREQGSL
jgi:hypothetical protein